MDPIRIAFVQRSLARIIRFKILKQQLFFTFKKLYPIRIVFVQRSLARIIRFKILKQKLFFTFKKIVSTPDCDRSKKFGKNYRLWCSYRTLSLLVSMVYRCVLVPSRHECMKFYSETYISNWESNFPISYFFFSF